MAGHTPKLGLWYPDGTDPISAGDDGLRELTTTLDNKLGVIGYVSVHYNFPASPTSGSTLTASSIYEQSGAQLGTIVGGRFVLSNAGTYHYGFNLWFNVAGDGWPIAFASVVDATADLAFGLTVYDYANGDWAAYCNPYGTAATTHLPVNWQPISVDAWLHIQRVA